METGNDSMSSKYHEEFKTRSTKGKHSSCSVDHPFLAIGRPVVQSRNGNQSNMEIVQSNNTQYVPTMVSLQKGSNRFNGFLNSTSQRRNINNSNVVISEYLQQQ